MVHVHRSLGAGKAQSLRLKRPDGPGAAAEPSAIKSAEPSASKSAEPSASNSAGPSQPLSHLNKMQTAAMPENSEWNHRLKGHQNSAIANAIGNQVIAIGMTWKPGNCYRFAIAQFLRFPPSIHGFFTALRFHAGRQRGMGVIGPECQSTPLASNGGRVETTIPLGDGVGALLFAIVLLSL